MVYFGRVWVGGWYRVGVGGCYRVGVGGWFRVGLGGCYRVWVGGWYRVGVVVLVDMQPCMVALVYSGYGNVTHPCSIKLIYYKSCNIFCN